MEKIYFDFTKGERDAIVERLGMGIRACRIWGRIPTDETFGEDQDVDIYLAHLILAASLPDYDELAEPYLSSDTSKIVQWVKSTEDRTIRYFVYKVNADRIVLDYIFRNPLVELESKQKVYRFSVAGLFYDQAATYHARIYRKETGVGECLRKLKKNLEEYLNVLACADFQSDVRAIFKEFRDRKMKGFLLEFSAYERKVKAVQLADELLDEFNQGRISKEDLERKLKGERI